MLATVDSCVLATLEARRVEVQAFQSNLVDIFPANPETGSMACNCDGVPCFPRADTNTSAPRDCRKVSQRDKVRQADEVAQADATECRAG